MAYSFHLHALKGKYSRLISFFITSVFVVTLVMCSISFGFVYNLLDDGKKNAQKVLGANISWSAIYINFFSGVTTALDLSFKDLEDKKEFMGAEVIKVAFYRKKIIKSLLTENDSSSNVLQKTLRFLALLDFEGSRLVISDTDLTFYDNLFAVLFKLKQMPEHTQINFPNIKTYAQFNSLEFRSDRDISTYVVLEGGNNFIRTQVVGNADILSNKNFYNSNFTMSLDLDITTDSFFKFTKVEGVIEQLGLKDAFALRPFNLNASIEPEQIVFDVNSVRSDLNFNGSVDKINKEFIIEANADKVNFDTLVKLEKNNNLEFLYKDTFSAEGKLRYNTESGNALYTFLITNENKDVNNINIELFGDENVLEVKNFIIQSQRNFLTWQNGSLALTDFSPQGNIEFDLNTSIGGLPITSGLFLFDRKAQKTTGTSSYLYINKEQQPQFNIVYLPTEKNIQLFLNNAEDPNLSIYIQGVATQTVYTEFKKTNITDGLGFTNQLMLQIYFNQYPTHTANAFASMFMKKPSVKNQFSNLLKDYFVNGNIVFGLDKFVLKNVVYDILISSTDKKEQVNQLFQNDNTLIRLVGKYRYNIWSIDEGLVTFGKDKDKISFIASYYHGENTATGFENNRSARRFSANLRIESKSYEEPIVYNITSFFEDQRSTFLVNEDTAILILKKIGNNFYITARTKQLLLPLGYRINNSTFNLDIVSNTPQLFFMTAEIDKRDIITKKYKKVITMDVSLDDKNVNINKYGKINSLYIGLNDKALESSGEFSFTKDIWDIKLYARNTNRLLFLNEYDNPLFHIKYNVNTKIVDVDVNNFNLKTILNDTKGMLSGNGFIKTDLSEYSFVLDESEITVNENTFLTKGQMLYKDGLLSINDVVMSTEEVSIEIPSLTVREKQLKGTYDVRVARKNMPSLQGVIVSNIDTSFSDVLTSIKEKHMPFLKLDFSVIPYYTSEQKEIPSQYIFNFSSENTKEQFILKENAGRVLLVRENDGSVHGTLGSPTQAVHILLDGNIDRNVISVDVDVKKIQIDSFFRDLVLSDVLPFDVQSLLLSGKLFFRGDVRDPEQYGFLEASKSQISISFVSDEIFVPKVNVLIANNELVLSSAVLYTKDGALGLGAKGYFKNYILKDMAVNVFTPDDSVASVRQLEIGSVRLTGMTQGLMSVKIDVLNAAVDITGVLDIENMDIAVLQKKKKVEKDKLRKFLDLSVDLNFRTRHGVVFIWPSPNFPILRGYLKENQKLNLQYDSEAKQLITNGSIEVDGGTLYYLDTAFNLQEAVVVFDEFFGLKNPYILRAEAITPRRYDGKTYKIILRANNTQLSDFAVKISTEPTLTPDEMVRVMGQRFVPSTLSASNNTTADNDFVGDKGIFTTVAGLSAPLSNLGVFSRFEQELRRSLRVDYFAFNTNIIQNLISFTANSDATKDFNNGEGVDALNSVGYFFDGSSLEIGKYIDIIYFNFGLHIKTSDLFTNNRNFSTISNMQVDSVFNVEIPTPYFDVLWSFDLPVYDSVIDATRRFEPMSFLTISWQRKF